MKIYQKCLQTCILVVNSLVYSCRSRNSDGTRPVTPRQSSSQQAGRIIDRTRSRASAVHLTAAKHLLPIRGTLFLPFLRRHVTKMDNTFDSHQSLKNYLLRLFLSTISGTSGRRYYQQELHKTCSSTILIRKHK